MVATVIILLLKAKLNGPLSAISARREGNRCLKFTSRKMNLWTVLLKDSNAAAQNPVFWLTFAKRNIIRARA